MRLRSTSSLLAILLLSGASLARAEECPGNPDAIGTSRTIVVDPLEHGRIGSMQYAETLPLADKEVVLTFDDGPLPPHTGRVLDILAANCVKATFFLVGRQAQAFPDGVRRVYDAGHTVGTHTQNHPHAFQKIVADRGIREIDEGIAHVSAALGDTRPLAPFFRFPGFGRSAPLESYLAGRGLMVWGADAPADDWMHITPEEVTRRAITRIEQKGRGVLLLHDIQRITVAALPNILHELKARGFRIVHVVPARPDRPKTVTDPSAWAFRHGGHKGGGGDAMWPPALVAHADAAPVLPAPSRLSFGFPDPFAAKVTIPSADGAEPPAIVANADLRLRSAPQGKAAWPAVAGVGHRLATAPVLPIPSAESLDIAYPRRSKAVPAKAASGSGSSSALRPKAELAVVAQDEAGATQAREKPAVWARLMRWFR